MVATTLRKPANSIVAARCTASSACARSPFAVSHALRNAQNAPLSSLRMSSATVRFPPPRQKRLSSGAVSCWMPWHARWTICMDSSAATTAPAPASSGA
jgi:hypothetical protein